MEQGNQGIHRPNTYPTMSSVINMEILDRSTANSGAIGMRHADKPQTEFPIDQLRDAIEMIRKTPDSRRIIVSAWNPDDIEEMAKAGLPPCHCFFQFYVVDGKLSCQLYQRSCDMFLGVPFNIASYSLLTMMVASVTDLQPGDLFGRAATRTST